MSDFTCRNGHAVSIKDKFCPICGLPVRYEDRRIDYITYEEYVREWEKKKQPCSLFQEPFILDERYSHQTRYHNR